MLTSKPDIYAAGDVTESTDLVTGETRLMPIWPNAYIQGRAAGLAMAGKPARYAGALSINAAHFFEFPIISAGLVAPLDHCVDLVESNTRAGYYRRIILQDNIPIGAVMTGDAVDRAGLVVNLIRNRTDASSFLDKLARPDFSNAHLPTELRAAVQTRRQ